MLSCPMTRPVPTRGPARRPSPSIAFHATARSCRSPANSITRLWFAFILLLFVIPTSSIDETCVGCSLSSISVLSHLIATSSALVTAQIALASDIDHRDEDDLFVPDENDDNDKTAYPTIRALVNRSVGLPCNISQTKEANSIKLILWYRNNILGEPIYSIDARENNITAARHFVADRFQGRATFELSLASRTALLFIKPVHADDDGHYICRVDLRWTRTTISTVRLDVIVPPSQLGLGEHRQPNWRPASSDNVQHEKDISSSEAMINYVHHIVTPESIALSLNCDALGGKPPAMVKWYRLQEFEHLGREARARLAAKEMFLLLETIDDGKLELIDDSYAEINATTTTSLVRNELHLGAIGEAHHERMYLCRASNSNMTRPLDLMVELHVLTRPKSIQIRQQLAAKKFYAEGVSSSDGSVSPPSPHSFPHNQTLHSIELLDYYLATANHKDSRSQPHNDLERTFRLRSGFESEFVCQVNGSRPAANISWHVQDQRTGIVKDITQLSFSSYNEENTLSLVQMMPKFTDNRARLVCRAYNRPFDGETLASAANNHNNASQLTSLLETSVVLNVNYPPIVSIKVRSGRDMFREVQGKASTNKSMPSTGSSGTPAHLHPSHAAASATAQARLHRFVELEEIFFNCSVNANPTAHSVRWFRNDRQLETNLNQGVIITNANQTLIVSSASPKLAGSFHCQASNMLGETSSDHQEVDILFAPRCQVDSTQTSYHRLGEVVRLKCQILANPSVYRPFLWKFNGTTFLGNEERGGPGDRVELLRHANLTSAALDHLALVSKQKQRRQFGKSAQPSIWETTTVAPGTILGDSAGVVHTNVQRKHLTTNVITIVLSRWESFGHFSCASSNQMGSQLEGCQWQLLVANGSDAQLGGQHSRRRQHYHHHHAREQLPAEILNNCQIIESSNAVVVKCAQRNDLEDNDDRTREDDQFELSPAKLNYHVQVYRLPSVNQSETSARSEQYSHQIDKPRVDQPEPGKRVADQIAPSLSEQHASQLVFHTINFTNPLFIITNLSSSTNYLLRIWSSKSHLGSTVEQVNITVRTRSSQLEESNGAQPSGVHRTKLDLLASLTQLAQHPMTLLLGSVLLISLIFLTITLAYALVKIRAVLEIRKARRDVNVNESISVFETALCEMRPETLESDLKNDNPSAGANYATLLDTFRPYVNVMSIDDSATMVTELDDAGKTMSRLPGESSFINYQHYLYPQTTQPSSASHNHHHRSRLEDEDSNSTNNTASMQTTTTDSTFASHKASHLSYTPFPPEASNLILCTAPDTSSSQSFLVSPEPYPHGYPLQLQILTETREEHVTLTSDSKNTNSVMLTTEQQQF